MCCLLALRSSQAQALGLCHLRICMRFWEAHCGRGLTWTIIEGRGGSQPSVVALCMHHSAISHYASAATCRGIIAGVTKDKVRPVTVFVLTSLTSRRTFRLGTTPHPETSPPW